jgi:hypothetical protein
VIHCHPSCCTVPVPVPVPVPSGIWHVNQLSQSAEAAVPDQRMLAAVASRTRNKSATTVLSLAMPFLLSAASASTTTNPHPLSPFPRSQNNSRVHRLQLPARRLPSFPAVAPGASFAPLPQRLGMASLAASAAAAAEVTHLTQRDAAEIDEQLMGPLGFSVDQLMVRGFPPPSCCFPGFFCWWLIIKLLCF